MFFESNSISVNILDVFELKQCNVDMFNSGRNFSALSFRLHSDACLSTKTDEYHMKDNCISFVPAGLDYFRTANTDELIVIHFNTTIYHPECIDFFIPKNSDVLLNMFQEILKCWNKKDVGYKYKCTAIFYEIIAICFSEKYKSNISESKIQNSIDYIHKNYTDKNLSITEIAKHSYMSEVYFRKLFKKEFGLSPKKYIIKLRIQKAIDLISTGYFTLSEVSCLSGYDDYKHFSTEFKKLTGVSPSNYIYSYTIN